MRGVTLHAEMRVCARERRAGEEEEVICLLKT